MAAVDERPVANLSGDRVTIHALLNAQDITGSSNSAMKTALIFKIPAKVEVEIGGFTYHLKTSTLGIGAAHPIGVAIFVRDIGDITTLHLEGDCHIVTQEETLEALYTARVSFPTSSLY